MTIERSLVTVVDDDVSVRESLTALLRELGFTARAFASAEEFLTSGCLDQTRCLLLDVAMPGGNGLSACEMLVNDDDCASIPVMILTGKTDHDTIRRCHQMAAYYIEKCPNVWTRVGPLLRELLEDAQAARPGNEPASET